MCILFSAIDFSVASDLFLLNSSNYSWTALLPEFQEHNSFHLKEHVPKAADISCPYLSYCHAALSLYREFSGLSPSSPV